MFVDAPKEKKKKASRWGDADQKVIIPGMPTILPTNLTEEQNKIYLSELAFLHSEIFFSPLICTGTQRAWLCGHEVFPVE